MFKLIAKQNDYLLKSYDIGELWRFVISHTDWDYQFYIDYTPITIDEFLKTYLQESKDFRGYLFLFHAMKKPRTIQEICRKEES